MSCSISGFKTLTDALIEQRGELEKRAIRLNDMAESLKDSDALFKECQTRLAAVPPAPPPKSPLWPALGIGAAVVGSFAISAATLGPVPDTMRFPVSMIGIVFIGTGVGLAWP